MGVVTSVSTPYDQFNVEQNGSSIPLTQVQVEAETAETLNDAEYFVGVEWTKTVAKEHAAKEGGFFGKQNAVAQPRAAKWNYTVERLKSLWGVQ